MTIVTKKRACGVAACLLAGAALLLPTTVAQANPLPPWDHYETYRVGDAPGRQVTVVLEDQFGLATHLTSLLEQFGVPVSKNGEMIAYPLLHYTWWQIDGSAPGRRVIVNNQFGEQALDVSNPRYLWNPALKNPVPGQAPPTDANHYKCYFASGQAIYREVRLETQFGTEIATVREPEVFCNPTSKTDPTGRQYPIIDPHQHYVCYRLDPVHLLSYQVPVMDQFLFEPLYLTASRYLCVPSIKTGVVPTVPSTWSRVRALYR
jgi:hypothetical protein